MFNKKGYYQIGAIIAAFFVFMVVMSMIPLISNSVNQATCKNEKEQITNLNSNLQDCQNALTSERQKVQDALSGLGDCQDKLSDCNNDLNNCRDAYSELEDECAKKEQPVTQFYFIKVFSDKIILFEQIILYHLHMFGIFLSFGITFTLKLFEIDITVKVLNKKNQKKLVRVVRQYLAEHPYMPIIFMIIVVLITNLIRLI